MDAHLFTWMKNFKLEENKKSKFKISKKKKKKASLDSF